MRKSQISFHLCAKFQFVSFIDKALMNYLLFQVVSIFFVYV